MFHAPWQWEDVLDSIHSDILIADANGIVLYVNKAVVEEFYSLGSDELVGKSVFDLEEQRVFYPSVIKKVLLTGQKQTVLQQTKSGKKMLVTGTIMYDEKGEIKWVVTYSHDATELVKLKEYVNVIEDEIQKMRHELLELRNGKKKEGFISASPKMHQILEVAKRISDANATVLLTGESGVGKNEIAKYIHYQSGRKGPLVEINCGSIPENLLESELFGYAPGAFTGANPKGSKGLVETAQDGTLFLDEIGEVPLSLQVKLLTLIQEKKFFRVGENKPRTIDFRLIAATNVDLESKVKTGAFRQDLFFRLSVIPIQIPPLRERQEDLLAMIAEFTQRFNTVHKKDKALQQNAIDCLLHYQWPGNVRELENLIERLILTVEDPVIRKEHLPQNMQWEGYTDPFLSGADKSLPELLDELEGNLVRQAYKKCRTTIEMAKMLGISQPTVVRKLRKYQHMINDMHYS